MLRWGATLRDVKIVERKTASSKRFYNVKRILGKFLMYTIALNS